jgi:predicted enzyme related to lactoylglutathione lyase
MTATEKLDELGTQAQGVGIGIVHIRVGDADRAAAFFGPLLHWDSERHENERFVAHYVTNTSLLTVLTDDADAPAVRLFFPVDDLPAAIGEVEALGATLVASDPEDGGGWAYVDDGQGVPLGIWHPTDRYSRTSSPTDTADGAVGYLTLHVDDGARAAGFYSRFLGWQFDAPRPNGYRHVRNALPAIGLYGDGGEHDPITWYIRVADLAAVIDRVPALGGHAEAPRDSPSGRSATCTDDQGMIFRLWQPAEGY